MSPNDPLRIMLDDYACTACVDAGRGFRPARYWLWEEARCASCTRAELAHAMKGHDAEVDDDELSEFVHEPDGPSYCAACTLPLRVLRSGAVRHYGVSTLIHRYV
jgi:hypothetical protein